MRVALTGCSITCRLVNMQRQQLPGLAILFGIAILHDYARRACSLKIRYYIGGFSPGVPLVPLGGKLIPALVIRMRFSRN